MNISNIYDQKPKILSPSKLSRWFFSLESLTSSGISIMQALDILEENFTDKNIAGSVKKCIAQGDSLTKAMEKAEVFDSFSLSIVECGERSGNLEKSFQKLYGFYESIHRFQKDFMNAMYYPGLILFCIGFLLLFIIFYFVPSILNMYGGEIPKLAGHTKILIMASLLLNSYFLQLIYTLFLIGFSIYFGLSCYFRRNNGLPLSFRLPVLGEVLKKQKLNEFVWSMSIMLESGVDILSATDILSQNQKTPYFKNQFGSIRRHLAEGVSFKESLSKSKLQDGMLLYFTGLGEDTGDLAGKLHSLSNRYKTDIEREYKLIASMVQPVMVLLMVLMVGALMIGVVLPLLDMDLLYKM